MMARVEAEVEREGKTSLERRDFLSSAEPSARRFATAVAPTGTSKTDCIGSWVSSSMML